MSSSAKRYGNDYERLVAGYLGLERYPAGFHTDLGDLFGDLLFTVECKARRSGKFELSAWLAQAKLEGLKAGKWAIVVIKRPRMKVEESYVVMDLATFREIRGWLDVP